MGVGAVYDRTFLEAVGCALTERTYTSPGQGGDVVVHRPAQVVQVVAAFQ